MAAVNFDGRNLWSIAGLAHEEVGEKRKRPHVNEEIKKMIQHFAELGYLERDGLATHSTANRGNKRRIEERCVDVPGEAASSSSRRPPSPVTNESKPPRKPEGLRLERMRRTSASSSE